ncbi:hypothetical protein K505DRAFT_228731 [Melanomma pulvis-pyrius CBS 109.77]|uniref:F-box domain-containing protein n=1 Tax=Melanomma pulvis-pyrius CBS 109.77 TaxID=1314802 RepID=A0A6A6XWX2_9PLEO|nr:hypothetical protein K505DRAFT_228731 [Melanomma pulvis-pyrius CBS 109.77]
MSQAAGAPPPPPPPPPPKKNVHDLPAELLLSIIQYLKINDYVTFALAIYPVLRSHGLVPPLSVDIYNRITLQQPPPDGRIAIHWTLPAELTEEIMSYLEPADRIAFLFSHRELFMEYLPGLSQETKTRLWKSRNK